MKRILVAMAIIILLAPSMVFAEGIASTFEVDYVRADSDGRGFVGFSSNLTNTPASCTDSGYEKMLAFNTSTDGGKAVYALALTAKASGKRIYAKGTGACTTYSGVMEDWAWGRIVD